MNGHAILHLAEALATVAHDGQCRKGAGEPYIEHPRRVAAAVKGWELKSIAWLHDVLEDTHIDIWVLRELFPADIVEAVEWLTKDSPLYQGLDTYQQRIKHLANLVDNGNGIRRSQRLAIKVKIADIQDNLHDLDELPVDYQGMRKRYERALAVLENDDEEKI